MRVDPAQSAAGKALEVFSSPRGPAAASGDSFTQELKTLVKSVDDRQHDAEASMVQGATGGADGIHETMIRLEEADLSLRLLMKARSKALEAYQDIMRMQF